MSRIPPAAGPAAIEPVDGSTPAAGSTDENAPPVGRSRLSAVRDGASAALGVVMGLVPHVLHHIAPLAGAALTAGAGGSILFFIVGLLFSIPMLRRLYHRFHTWAAPAIAVVVFAGLFALSAFVIGPAISGTATQSSPVTPAPVEHDTHHTP